MAYVDHRQVEAMRGNQGGGRGWDFDRAVDESPMWLRALAEAFRPRSLIIFAVIGFTVALWWL